jgi:hypothetical protein
LTHLRIISAVALALCGSTLAGLAGCGHHSASAPIGVGNGVTLATTNSTGTLLALGQSLTMTATVLNDPNNLGVVWTLLPQPNTALPITTTGGLTQISKTSVVYTAPAYTSYTDAATNSKAGEVVLSLTATSVADPNYYTTATIVANGTPLIPAEILLPGNQNVGYATTISVIGGTAPYTWSLSAGTLPAGLSLGTSTGTLIAITGTPTAITASPPPTFTLSVTDANSESASTSFSIKVHEQTGCIIDGTYTFGFSAYAFSEPGNRAGTVTIANDGTITGEQDYKDLNGARVAEQITSGQCTSQGGNRIHLQVISPSGEVDYNAGLLSTLQEGRLIEADGTSVYGVGKLVQLPIEPTLASLAGDYTLGLVGSDGTGLRRAVVGRLTLDASGQVSGGEVDGNGARVITAGTLSGSFSVVDGQGRGTATLTIAGETLQFAYYAMQPGIFYLVDVDSAKTSSRLGGYLQTQAGAGTFDNSSFNGNWVIELAGSTGITQPMATTSLGLIGFVDLTNSTASMILDVVDRGTPAVTSSGGGTFTVDPNGRATYRATLATGPVKDYTFYLGAPAVTLATAVPSTGFAIETTGGEGAYGLIEQQPAGFLLNFTGGAYVGATLLPASAAPLTMEPTESISGGSLGGNISGTYALDPVSGRGIALVSQDVLGGIGTIFYVVTPSHVVMMGNGVNSVNSAIVSLDY